MCGIVGYIGNKRAYDVLVQGLHRLEYRGYDSAGVAIGKEEGTLNVFDCSKFTVGGETVTSFLAIDTNGDREGDEGEAITDGVFHESTLRSAPYFSLKIDGINELNNN